MIQKIQRDEDAFVQFGSNFQWIFQTYLGNQISGSRIANCTATVYCDGRIRLAKSTKGTCENEVFAMTDGTIGFMSGCGTFHFGGTPRTPRNKGRDMYVYYKGVSNTSKCIAFCLEDLKMSPSLKPARPMALSKTFTGFETDNSCGMAALMFKGEGYERNPFCGGAIVNNLYVITAAHCFVETGVQANQIEVLFHAHVMDKGTDDGSTPADDDPEYKNIPGWALPPETDKTEYSIRRDVESVTVHPLFDRTYDYDVAIIKLKKKLTFKNPEMLPICLPEIEDILNYPDGERFLVSGWGKPTEKAKAGARVLQKLYVPYTHLTQCRTFTKATFRHLCAGYLEGGKDACSGDSGGPLVHPTTPNGSQYMLAGLVSAGKGCARREVLGLYSNVYAVDNTQLINQQHCLELLLSPIANYPLLMPLLDVQHNGECWHDVVILLLLVWVWLGARVCWPQITYVRPSPPISDGWLKVAYIIMLSFVIPVLCKLT
ncbi:unnamed protein product [Orchesella dallaii]|uniref:Peptidase S1 domain-containing protein n=1 Tax=Orchesella dallaii TaxID=48710 RepID=A0ABP1RHQ0_9HEXA